MINAVNSYAGNGGDVECQSAPRTIASAVGSLRSLHEGLDDIISRLNGIADQIGGPRLCGASEGKQTVPAPGVLSNLHDAADGAHSRVATISELVATIARQLG